MRLKTISNPRQLAALEALYALDQFRRHRPAHLTFLPEYPALAYGEGITAVPLRVHCPSLPNHYTPITVTVGIRHKGEVTEVTNVEYSMAMSTFAYRVSRDTEGRFVFGRA